MTRAFSNQLLSKLSEFVAGQMGLHFPQERWRDLERGVRAAAREFGAPDAVACAQELLSAPLSRSQIEILASQLTIGETYFFREKRSLEILGERILPELIRARQGAEPRLRIWSAGCCTGEEPYSIAILLDRVLPEPRQWQVTILATDINPGFLKKAAEGTYREWSFRGAPSWLKKGYFKEISEHRFEILPRIKEKVTFTCLNLTEDVYPSLTNNTNAMDLIFCRNVLMYFAADRAKRVIDNFHRSLIEGGWLIVSPTEASAQLLSPFVSVHFEGAILYRKEGSELPATAVPFGWETAGTSHAEKVALIPSATWLTHDFMPPLVSSTESASESAPAGEQETQTSSAQPTRYEEAVALFARGRYLDAAQKLRANSTDSEMRIEELALFARTCANLGELAEARTWAEKAITADKLNAGLHYLRAMILQEQGASDEAVAALKRALYLDPHLVLAHFALGNLALRHGRFKEADKHFTNVLALLKDYSDSDVLPESDGLAAGRLRDMVRSAKAVEQRAA